MTLFNNNKKKNHKSFGRGKLQILTWSYILNKLKQFIISNEGLELVFEMLVNSTCF